MKSGGNWSKKKTFKDYTIFILYICPGEGKITLGEQNFDCNQQVLL